MSFPDTSFLPKGAILQNFVMFGCLTLSPSPLNTGITTFCVWEREKECVYRESGWERLSNKHRRMTRKYYLKYSFFLIPIVGETQWPVRQGPQGDS